MFDDRIKEIIFFQSTHDRVKYIAEGLDKAVSVSVKNFFKLLHESGVIPANIFDFNKAFDSFETVKLNLETGHWKILDIDDEQAKGNASSMVNMQEGLRKAMNQTTGLNKKLDILHKKALNTKTELYRRKDKDDKK